MAIGGLIDGNCVFKLEYTQSLGEDADVVVNITLDSELQLYTPVLVAKQHRSLHTVFTALNESYPR
jgi:hypothetical protein